MLSFVGSSTGDLTELEGNFNIDLSLRDMILDKPTSIYNKNILIDSKQRGIRSRFLIPFCIDGRSYLVLLESKRVETIIGNEDAIYQDIVAYIMIVSNKPLC